MLRKLKYLPIIVLMGCSGFPQIGSTISENSLNADYPKLMALSQEGLPTDNTSGSEVIEELDNRTASLWYRIGLFRN